jgi:TRAP-type C4-dicarboxylate transport system substrate-binding protein
LAIKPFVGGELFKIADNFISTKKGIVEMMYSPGSYWLGIMPECNWETGLPYTTLAREEEIDLMYNHGLINLLREAYAEHNMYYLVPSPTGPRGFMSNRPIRTVADYKGLKARCTGPEADLLKELGGSPVFITGAEVYTALQLKTVDAASWTMMAWSHMNFREAAKYYCLPRTANMVVALVVNMDAWKTLPDDLKKIMEWSARDWILYNATHYHAVETTQENQMDSDRMVVLSKADQAIVQKAAFKVWDNIAKMSPRNAKAVELIRNYLRKIGRLQ